MFSTLRFLRYVFCVFLCTLICIWIFFKNYLVENTDYSNHRFKHLAQALYFFGFNKGIDSNNCLFLQWQKFETILTAFVLLKMLKITTPVSKYLQTKHFDYVSAWNQITKLFANTDDLINLKTFGKRQNNL